MLKYLIITAALAITPMAAQAAQPTPDWGSDRIRSERPSGDQTALQLNYTQTIRPTHGPVTTQTGTITLASDFNEVVMGDVHALDDFALCRSLLWTSGKAEVDNRSCYADPAFRLAELANRKQLSQMLTQAGGGQTPPPAILADYWAEQELAMRYKAPDRLSPKSQSGETQWQLGDDVVATTGAPAFTFTASERQAVARYFARHSDLHPQILQAILASGQWPQRLVIERRTGDEGSTETLEFSNFHSAAVAYPLPAGLPSALTIEADSNTPRGRGLRQAMSIMTGTGPAKPSLQSLLDGVVAAAHNHRGMEGTMLFFEITQLYTAELASDEGLARIRKINASITAVYRSPEAKSFVDAGDLAGKHGGGPDREAAARFLSQASEMDKLPFGTFRYVTFANLARYTDDAANWDKAIFAAMPSLSDGYWLHIAAAPWGSNVYNDLGDSLYADFDTAGAWEAWDIGRAVDPDWQTGVMKFIPSAEGKLRQDAPDSF